jgi:hypothetical protein
MGDAYGMNPMKRFAILFAFIGICAPAGTAQTRPKGAILVMPHFVFYSDLATNTHDALIAVAIARRSQQPSPFSASEQACFERLPARERDAWNRAVDDYVAGKSTNLQRLSERWVLAGLIDEAPDADRQFLRTWLPLLTAATRAYRRCRWPAQDRLNREWIARVKPLLATYELSLADELLRRFAKPWSGLPFRVDLVNSGGGNSASPGDPPRTLHILASSANPQNQGQAALELVFHEAAHYLATPDSPLGIALQKAGADAGVTLPPDILHEVHFFITGEAVRRAFAQHGAPPYTPWLFALKLFSDPSRAAVSRTWQGYIDGARSLDEAARDLAGSLKTSAPR